MRIVLIFGVIIVLMGTSCVENHLVSRSLLVSDCKDPIPELISQIDSNGGSAIRRIKLSEAQGCANLVPIFQENSGDAAKESLIVWDKKSCKLVVAKIFTPKSCRTDSGPACEEVRLKAQDALSSLFQELRKVSPGNFKNDFEGPASFSKAREFISKACNR